MNFFFLAFEWLALVFTLFVVSFIQLIKLIKERKKLSKLRVQYLVVFLVIFLLTLFRSTTNKIIEKIDWQIFYNRRTEIVKKVIDQRLNPNVNWNNYVCELPYEFPIVSNGGNDIGIYRNKKNGKTTVCFWVYRNYFDSPSTHFVFTNDPIEIKTIEEKIKTNPTFNWKIEKNWYRTYGE
ncbi:MAG: hypothetical protein V4622_09940 [Bacteroidota bacterium]